VIRIAVLDDHPAVLAGLQRLVERAPDLLPVATVTDQEALWGALDHTPADIVVVDYDLSRGDGLEVCRRLKERLRPPSVIVYSAYAGPALALAARLAGADGLVHKSEPVGELLDAIRRVAGGDTVLPEVSLEIRQAAMRRLREDDVAIAAMLLAGTDCDGIAEALALERREVSGRIRRIVARVRPVAPPHELQLSPPAAAVAPGS
jgi:DNA-binding NarL/FixJ family response regulator